LRSDQINGKFILGMTQSMPIRVGAVSMRATPVHSLSIWTREARAWLRVESVPTDLSVPAPDTFDLSAATPAELRVVGLPLFAAGFSSRRANSVCAISHFAARPSPIDDHRRSEFS
jgi:hypothetical protein